MEGRLFLAVPVMNEGAFLPATLHSLTRQTLPPTRVYICVNQPDAWHEGTPAQRAVCRDNGETLAWLRSFRELPLTVLDRSTPGKGWQGKRSGAGWARKVLMDAIDADARDEDILVSMDGDTFYKPGYLEAVCDSLGAHPRATALSAPFYHPLGPVEEQNRALLRYELYMRHYFLNLLRIDSPYAFLALGSTISLPVWAYRKVGGISPFKAGEDFYFLQKLAKVGRVLNACESVVYPAARLSDRVDFGTGPAILKGVSGSWGSYPFFPEKCFEHLRAAYDLFPLLFDGHRATPLDPFLEDHFGTADLWTPLRKNFRTRSLFVRACHERIDGLRIRQYLGFCRKKDPHTLSDEEILMAFAIRHLPECPLRGLDFDKTPVADLDALRNAFFSLELAVRAEQGAKGRVLQRPGSLPRPGRYSWPDGPRG